MTRVALATVTMIFPAASTANNFMYFFIFSWYIFAVNRRTVDANIRYISIHTKTSISTLIHGYPSFLRLNMPSLQDIIVFLKYPEIKFLLTATTCRINSDTFSGVDKVFFPWHQK